MGRELPSGEEPFQWDNYLQSKQREASEKQRLKRRNEAERQLDVKPKASSRSLTFVACFQCIWHGTAKGVKSCLQRRNRFAKHLKLQHFIKEVNNITMG